MSNQTTNQSFNVDDIRRVREKADIHYKNMSSDEISKDIYKHARIGYRILENLKRETEEYRQQNKHFYINFIYAIQSMNSMKN